MSYRLVALDIDGTLVTKTHVISAANREAIQCAQRRGVLVTLATGRMFQAARPFARQLEIDLPIITYQGSIIRLALSGETLLRTDIDTALAMEVVSFLEHRPGRLFLYVDDLLVAAAEDEITAKYLTHSPEVRLTLAPDMSAWLRNGGQQRPLTKVVYMADADAVSGALVALEPQFASRLELTRTYPHFLEIGPKGVHKGSALIWLANYFGIPMEQTMVLGDSANDIDMFKVAGLAVAVSDGQEQARAAAHAVTAACGDDGVAAALKRYVLCE